MRLAALLHDAAEAYIGDIQTPLKEFLSVDENGVATERLALLEHDILRWVAAAHGFNSCKFAAIDYEDRRALATEFRDLMAVNASSSPTRFVPTAYAWRERVEPWNADYARCEWLAEYRRLFPSAVLDKGKA